MEFATIGQLIASKREGEYWDFKLKHHENPAKLVHHIICLANSLCKQDKYLIFGVADPAAHQVCDGVPAEHRRTQANIIDILRQPQFSGDLRPEVELHTFPIGEVEIDVLIIFDRPNKPYTLIRDFTHQGRTVKANHIYTRVTDTNTPINSSADLNHVEHMWRERFGLDLKPAQKILELMRDSVNWENSIGSGKPSYHQYSSEYQIVYGDVRECTEVFSYFYPNRRSFYGLAECRYLTTVLFEIPFVYCDEMRVAFPYPTTGRVDINRTTIWYMYFALETREGALLEHMTSNTLNFHSRGSEAAFVIFQDSSERLAFEEYLGENVEMLEAIPEDPGGAITRQSIEQAKDGYCFDPVTMMRVKVLHANWLAQIRFTGPINRI